MNFTPLDSSRQRASFQIKIFATFAKKKIFYFGKFLAQKKLKRSLRAKFIALSRLITELWPFEISNL
jgi:hypothetical protein